MFNLYRNEKHTSFYTYDKESKIIFNFDGKPISKSNIIYQIIEKYKDMISYLTDIKIIPNKSFEEADNNLVYSGYDNKQRQQYRYGVNYILSRKKKKLRVFLKVYDNMDTIQDIIDKGLSEPDNNKSFVFAAILLLELTFFIRLGKKIYYNENETVGLMTLTKKNLNLKSKDEFEISFKGKTGKNQLFSCKKNDHEILFNVLERLYNTAKDLDDYIFVTNKNERFTEKMLHDRLKQINLTLKDFRTYGVNIVLIKTLHKNLLSVTNDNQSSTKHETNLNKKTKVEEKFLKEIIDNSIKETANIIGHTKSISKNSYIADELQELIFTSLKEIKNNTFEVFLKSIINKLKQTINK